MTTNVKKDNSKKVLVLNKSWTPISVVTMKKAMKMLCCNRDGEPKARIIDPYQDFQQFTWAEWSKIKPKDGDVTIKSAHIISRMPKLIVLSKYDKPPCQVVRFNRRALYSRDDNTCQYCAKKFKTQDLNVDHVKPRSQGGISTWENCCLSCFKCNTKKGGRTPEQAGMKLIRKPFKPKYSLYYGDVKIENFDDFINNVYWNIKLEE